MNLSHRSLKFIYSFLLILSFSIQKVAGQDELDVISKNNQWLHYTDAPNALYHHLAKQAYQQLDKRTESIAGLSTLADWQERQKWIRETLQNIAGPFPEKTPLKPRVLRVLDKGTYRVEHIVFESQPGFYVTSSLFIPKSLKKKDKAPVVIYCSGHANEGYRSPVYQHVILNLVKKGFMVFAFDPVGQGERLEYFDPQTGKSSAGGPTSEHAYPGSQAFITGSSQARYMIWDGIRAVDYLLTRKEVDPLRIGITGRSGGGTQSAYIAAFDERILAAAPECYITSFTRLLQSIGPQDAEQNFFNGISSGIDHGDLLSVRAPKPALVITTTRDMFSIQGARETAKEVSRIYRAYGAEGNFEMVEDDAPHASTKKNREALYVFFQKSLGNPGTPLDEAVEILSEAEIKVTPTGQVSTSLGGETVFTLNRKESQQQIRALKILRNDPGHHLPAAVDAAKNLSGYREPQDVGTPVFTGRIQRDGYAIEKYFIKGEGDYVIPYLLLVPPKPNQKAILYLHPSGKAAEATVQGEMEWFVKNGFQVLAPDLPGIGELGSGEFTGDAFIGGISHNMWYSSILIGRSIAGIQAGDIARLIQSIQKNHGAETIYGVARKEMTPVLLHAAVFIPAMERIAFVEPLSSYGSLVINRFYHSPFISAAVPGALKSYDLPDLAAALAPRKLLMVNVTNGMGEVKPSQDIQEDISFIEKIYRERKAEGQLNVATETSREKLYELFSEWIR